jgi:hypothetical protein
MEAMKIEDYNNDSEFGHTIKGRILAGLDEVQASH